MFLRKINGNWYVCRNPAGSSNHLGRMGKRVVRDWFLIKQNANSGYIPLANLITCPKEFLGKKVRLKVEIIEFPIKSKEAKK